MEMTKINQTEASRHEEHMTRYSRSSIEYLLVKVMKMFTTSSIVFCFVTSSFRNSEIDFRSIQILVFLPTLKVVV